MASTKSYTQSAYSVLLLQKLLSLRDGISPLTLVLDTLQEPGTIVLEEFMLRAKAAGTRVVYASSFIAGPRRSPHIDVLVERRRKSLQEFRDDIIAKCQPPPQEKLPKNSPPQKTLVVVDSLCQIAQQDPLFVAAFVSSLVSPTASVLSLYHADEDPASEAAAQAQGGQGWLTFGKPPPLKVLCHLATAIIRVQALHEEVARKRARDRCEEEPRFGWAEGEGALFGYTNSRYNKHDVLVGTLYTDSVLVDMELRRRSGRAVVERFVVTWGQPTQPALAEPKRTRTQSRSSMPWDLGAVPCTNITVMTEHALFAAPPDPGAGTTAADGDDDEALPETTFSLGLTEKQRRDREGIVLPYFDAQTDIGSGEGGRILYEMGREDDFDDEEDEI
ncbi:killer toxin sensitivity protein [Grosmannia clavigera kw1407]|uniref:Elongator complex protein 5 n=1 Tax=Grosmannia clavigera (strain kw1407 / UAMH 11150) TaxID=655863 RepID=F0XFT7_GROCL|nr:killer toxin sensitivity protein [Grosmannia clavigera kw1407]EFX03944.1 killer toxin sensitivity protein [Grosmannia clavigera kw1407]